MSEPGLTAGQMKEVGDEFRRIMDRAQEGDRLTEAERQAVREVIALLPDMKKIVETRKITVTVYTAIGEFAKWAAGVIALVVFYRQFFGGGK